MIELSPDLSTIKGAPATFDAFLALEGEIFRQVGERKTLRFVAGNRGYFIKIHAGVGWREIFKNLFQGRLPVLGAKNEVRAIERLTTGRTSITVAHRLSTAEASDTVLVFDAGRIVERGPHSALVEADGVYSALHRDWAGAVAEQ